MSLTTERQVCDDGSTVVWVRDDEQLDELPHRSYESDSTRRQVRLRLRQRDGFPAPGDSKPEDFSVLWETQPLVEVVLHDELLQRIKRQRGEV